MNTKLTLSAIVGITVAIILVGALAPAIFSTTEESFHPTYSNGVGNGIEIKESTEITYTYDSSTFTHTYELNGETIAIPGGGNLLICTDAFVLKAEVSSASGSNFISFNDGAAKNINNITELEVILTPTSIVGTYSTSTDTDVALNLVTTWGYAYAGIGPFALKYSNNSEFFYNSVADVRGFMMSGDLGGVVAVTGDVAKFTDYYGAASTLSITSNAIDGPAGLTKIKMSTDNGFTIVKGTNNVTLMAFVISADVQGTIENGNTYSSLVSATVAILIVAILLAAVGMVVRKSD